MKKHMKMLQKHGIKEDNNMPTSYDNSYVKQIARAIQEQLAFALEEYDNSNIFNRKYKEGYLDGVLDMGNIVKNIMTEMVIELESEIS